MTQLQPHLLVSGVAVAVLIVVQAWKVAFARRLMGNDEHVRPRVGDAVDPGDVSLNRAVLLSPSSTSAMRTLLRKYNMPRDVSDRGHVAVAGRRVAAVAEPGFLVAGIVVLAGPVARG